MPISNPKRVKSIILAALFIEEVAATICLPVLSDISVSLKASSKSTNLILSAYLLGLAVSRPIYGILSDIYGRRNTIILGSCILLFGSLLASFIPILSWLIFSRFIQGFGGGVAIVIGLAVLCDIFNEKDQAKVISSLTMIVVIAPIISPIIGGEIIVQTGNWVYVFYLILILSIFILIICFLYMEETLPKERRIKMHMKTLCLSYIQIFKNTLFILSALSQSLTVGITWIWLAGIRVYYIDYLHVSANVYGYYNSLTIFAYLAGSIINYYLIKKRSPQKILSLGFALLIASLIIMTILTPIISQEPYLIQIANSIASASVALILPNSTSIATSQLKASKGSASALLGTMQMTAAAFATFLIGWINPNSIIQICLPMIILGLLSWSLMILVRKKLQNFDNRLFKQDKL